MVFAFNCSSVMKFISYNIGLLETEDYPGHSITNKIKGQCYFDGVAIFILYFVQEYGFYRGGAISTYFIHVDIF